jgi:hypothetical protein
MCAEKAVGLPFVEEVVYREAAQMMTFRHFALTPAGLSRSLTAFSLLKLCTLENSNQRALHSCLLDYLES